MSLQEISFLKERSSDEPARVRHSGRPWLRSRTGMLTVRCHGSAVDEYQPAASASARATDPAEIDFSERSETRRRRHTRLTDSTFGTCCAEPTRAPVSIRKTPNPDTTNTSYILSYCRNIRMLICQRRHSETRRTLPVCELLSTSWIPASFGAGGCQKALSHSSETN